MGDGTTKRCTKCGETKPVTEFTAERASKDGLYRWCKSCDYAKKLEWKAKNPDKVKAGAKRFNERHPERQKAWHKAWRDKNPDKTAAYTAKSRAKDPERYARLALAASLMRRYGITIEAYDDLLRKQGGVCAICKQPPTPGKKLCVDHCHETARVRGLLHQRCNRTLGLFDDDPEWFAEAARYLRST